MIFFQLSVLIISSHLYRWELSVELWLVTKWHLSFCFHRNVFSEFLPWLTIYSQRSCSSPMESTCPCPARNKALCHWLSVRHAVIAACCVQLWSQQPNGKRTLLLSSLQWDSRFLLLIFPDKKSSEYVLKTWRSEAITSHSRLVLPPSEHDKAVLLL
jgi:hypothetical protein